MKDVGRAKFCIGLEIKHLKNGIFVHQEAYTKCAKTVLYG